MGGRNRDGRRCGVGDEVFIRCTRIGDLNLDGTGTKSDFIDLEAGDYSADFACSESFDS